MKRKFRVALEGKRYLEGPQQTRAISFEAGSGTTFQSTLYFLPYASWPKPSPTKYRYSASHEG